MDDTLEKEESTSKEVDTPTYDKLELLEEAGRLHIKGYSNREIAETLNIDPRTASGHVNEYLAHLEAIVEDDPYFLDKVQINTMHAYSELNEISKESWETVEIATRDGMVTGRLQALRLALDTAKSKAQLKQLLGNATTSDAEMIARFQRQETVNAMVSKVINEVVSECSRCQPMSRDMLKEAFAMLDDKGFDSHEEVVEALDFTEAEVVE